METRVCTKCKVEKDLNDFGNDKTRKNGKSYLCKPCLIIKKKFLYKEIQII